MMDKIFERVMILQTRREITIELEAEINEALEEVFTRHNNSFRHVVDFEYGVWLPSVEGHD